MNKFVKFIIFLSIILMILILFYENVRAETDWKLSTDFHKTVAPDLCIWAAKNLKKIDNKPEQMSLFG